MNPLSAGFSGFAAKSAETVKGDFHHHGADQEKDHPARIQLA